jgi:hypothetical protein
VYWALRNLLGDKWYSVDRSLERRSDVNFKFLLDDFFFLSLISSLFVHEQKCFGRRGGVELGRCHMKTNESWFKISSKVVICEETKLKCERNRKTAENHVLGCHCPTIPSYIQINLLDSLLKLHYILFPFESHPLLLTLPADRPRSDLQSFTTLNSSFWMIFDSSWTEQRICSMISPEQFLIELINKKVISIESFYGEKAACISAEASTILDTICRFFRLRPALPIVNNQFC